MTKPVYQHEVPNLAVLDERDVVNVGMPCRDHLATAAVGQALLLSSIFNVSPLTRINDRRSSTRERGLGGWAHHRCRLSTGNPLPPHPGREGWRGEGAQWYAGSWSGPQ